MPSAAPLDCVIVGYNDTDFGQFAAAQKEMESRSGAYHEVKSNSVLLSGQRHTYMDLLSRVIESATGHNPKLNVFQAPQLGPAYLKHFLYKHGQHAEIVNLFNEGKDHLKGLLKQSPKAVAITTTFYVDNAPVIEIVKFIRAHSPDVKIIVGGPHVYNLGSDLDLETQDFLFEQMGADIYIVDSQGESTLVRVMKELGKGEAAQLGGIPNLCYTEDGETFVRTPAAPESNDLDESTIDWSIFRAEDIAPVTYLRTARSCPFACSFCNYPTMAGAYVVSTVDNVESQLKYLHSIGSTDLVFVDDTFNIPRGRFRDLLRMMIRNKFNFRWISFFRCSNADDEVIALMKESGCVGVLLGIESGDQRMLNLMNKAATLEKYRWGITALEKAGIATFVSLICGFPGETEESVMNTMRFIEETQPTFFNAQLYYHDLRAPIHKRAEEFGIQGAGYNWKHKTMDWREAAQWSTYLFGNIKNSIPLTLYGFSLWGMAYLMAKGIPLEKIKAFGAAARPLFMKSLADESSDFEDYRAEFDEIFRDVQIIQGGPVPRSNDIALIGEAA